MVSLLVICAAAARAATMVERAPLEGVEPVAACKLQALSDRFDKYTPQPVGLYRVQPPPEDALDNYERTPLGDWPMPASVERGDPWMRLLLVGPKRPLVIDLAVFIDGKPFRESREAWIDELLTPEKAEAIEGEVPAPGNGAEPSPGTNSTDAASEDETEKQEAATSDDKEETAKDAGDAKETGEKKDREKEKPTVSPGVKVQARQPPTMRERLQSYLAASGGSANRDEIRWLIAEWGSGPEVLLLGPSLSWQRAGFAPLTAYLDRDEDGGLSAAEIDGTSDLLRRADLDANDVLDANEMRRAANRPAATPFATGHSILVPLDFATNWDALATTLAIAYGANSVGAAVDGDDLSALATQSADVTLRVDFGTKEKQPAGVTVVAVSDNLGDASKIVSASAEVLTLDLGADYVEFSAAQGKVDGKADVGGTQVAVGAAIDGNPLERLLDRDNDHRLTTRERQELAGLLATLDRNGDGAVGSGEMPMPIRFAVTLGPLVHQLLATPVVAARTIAPRESAPSSPAWFVSMDKNSDHDLSRGEFLGTSEQFRQFDADGDGLLSVVEALKLKPGQ